MKLYILSVDVNSFEYDEIADAVILANSEEEAIVLAKEERDCGWEVDQVVDIDEPKVIISLIRHG